MKQIMIVVVMFIVIVLSAYSTMSAKSDKPLKVVGGHPVIAAYRIALKHQRDIYPVTLPYAGCDPNGLCQRVGDPCSGCEVVLPYCYNVNLCAESAR
jgi:hypothetical protein